MTNYPYPWGTVLGWPAPRRRFAFQDPYESDVHRARHNTEFGDLVEPYWKEIESQKEKEDA